MPLLEQLDQSMKYERRSVLDKSQLLVDVKLPNLDELDDQQEDEYLSSFKLDDLDKMKSKQRRVYENLQDDEDDDEEEDLDLEMDNSINDAEPINGNGGAYELDEAFNHDNIASTQSWVIKTFLLLTQNLLTTPHSHLTSLYSFYLFYFYRMNFRCLYRFVSSFF